MISRLFTLAFGLALALSIADAAPAQAQAACPTGTTRSGDRCLNAMELMTKQLNDAMAKMQGSVAWLTCPQGQTTLLDRQRCVTIEPWGNRTPLPDGTVIAIRLRHMMTDRSGNSAPYPNWLALSTSDNTTIAASGMLMSSGLFTIKNFVPPARIDAARFSLPWFALRAANGKHLKLDVGGSLRADEDEQGAVLFARDWQNAADFRTTLVQWRQATDYLQRWSLSQTQYRTNCLAAYGVPSNLDLLPFSTDCYYSRSVDFFIVKM